MHGAAQRPNAPPSSALELAPARSVQQSRSRHALEEGNREQPHEREAERHDDDACDLEEDVAIVGERPPATPASAPRATNTTVKPAMNGRLAITTPSSIFIASWRPPPDSRARAVARRESRRRAAPPRTRRRAILAFHLVSHPVTMGRLQFPRSGRAPRPPAVPARGRGAVVRPRTGRRRGGAGAAPSTPAAATATTAARPPAIGTSHARRLKPRAGGAARTLSPNCATSLSLISLFVSPAAMRQTKARMRSATGASDIARRYCTSDRRARPRARRGSDAPRRGRRADYGEGDDENERDPSHALDSSASSMLRSSCSAVTGPCNVRSPTSRPLLSTK